MALWDPCHILYVCKQLSIQLNQCTFYLSRWLKNLNFLIVLDNLGIYCYCLWFAYTLYFFGGIIYLICSYQRSNRFSCDKLLRHIRWCLMILGYLLVDIKICQWHRPYDALFCPSYCGVYKKRCDSAFMRQLFLDDIRQISTILDWFKFSRLFIVRKGISILIPQSLL